MKLKSLLQDNKSLDNGGYDRKFGESLPTLKTQPLVDKLKKEQEEKEENTRTLRWW